MIGRGARGNPWIFKRTAHYLETGELLAEPTGAEIGEMILRHARMQVKMKGEYIGMKEMRKHVAWYTAGYKHSAQMRREVNLVECYADLEKLLQRAIASRKEGWTGIAPDIRDCDK